MGLLKATEKGCFFGGYHLFDPGDFRGGRQRTMPVLPPRYRPFMDRRACDPGMIKTARCMVRIVRQDLLNQTFSGRGTGGRHGGRSIPRQDAGKQQEDRKQQDGQQKNTGFVKKTVVV